MRRLNHIYVWGGDIPDPLIHFADICGSSQELLNNLDEFGIVEPTPIQMQAIPLMMQNRDVLCSAPTGFLPWTVILCFELFTIISTIISTLILQ